MRGLGKGHLQDPLKFTVLSLVFFSYKTVSGDATSSSQISSVHAILSSSRIQAQLWLSKKECVHTMTWGICLRGT
jgi:hypothetical protein